MNHDLIIKTTQRITFYTCAALLYWTFIFLAITVFDLKIFRERLSEMFFLSLLGLFAILGGAIVLNLMSNLSKISAALAPVAPVTTTPKKGIAWRLALFALTFPLIAGALFAGDRFSAERKKALLIASAERLIAENQPMLKTLADYRFSPEFVRGSGKNLNILNKIDRNFPEVMVVFPDDIDGKSLFLGFGGRSYRHEDDAKIEKSAFIYSTSREEREFLNQVFAGKENNYLFHAEKGNYQLYYPTVIAGKKLVLYFSDYQRYGKLGS